MTLKKLENTGNFKKKHSSTLFTELALQKTMDLSHERMIERIN